MRAESAGRFRAALRGLEPDLRPLLTGANGPRPSAGLRIRVIPGHAHHVAVVEDRLPPFRSVVVKGPPRASTTHQSLETERRLLAEVAPALAAASPRTRCPALLAAFPEPPLLVMERVVGPTLDALLFGWRPRRKAEELARSCRWSGEWLARFHALTRGDQAGHPLAEVLEALAEPSLRRVLVAVLGSGPTEEILERGRHLVGQNPGYREPRGLVHADFTPRHVIVGTADICVIDLAGSRPGFPHEDLARFVAFADLRPPWRRALAERRLPFHVQEAALLGGYASLLPRTGPTPDFALRAAIVLRLARAVRDGRTRAARPLRAKLAALGVERRLQHRGTELLRATREAVPPRVGPPGG